MILTPRRSTIPPAAVSRRVTTLESASPLVTWTTRAHGLISRRIEDAAMHAAAGNAVTASGRLEELREELHRTIEDARAHFYRQAWVDHRREGLALHRSDLGPTSEGENAARGVHVLGRDHGADLRQLMSEARASLRLAGAGEDRDARDMWATTYKSRIRRHVERELLDSRTALHHAVGHLLTR
jgi:hypothetical protein